MFEARRVQRAITEVQSALTGASGASELRKLLRNAVADLKPLVDGAAPSGRESRDRAVGRGLMICSAVDYRLGEFEVAFTCLAIASTLILPHVHRDTPDADLASLATQIADMYGSLGITRREFEFASERENWVQADERLRGRLRVGATFLATQQRDHIAAIVGGGNYRELPEPLASAVGILQTYIREQDLTAQELTVAALTVGELEGRIAVNCITAAASRLAAIGGPAQAHSLVVSCTDRLRRRLDPLDAARLEQVDAALLRSLGELQLSLHLALRVWVTFSDVRYALGSSALRTASSGTFDVARYTALKCATRLGDWPLQLELIEARRLQSAAYLHGSADELDAVLRGEPLPDRAPRPHLTRVRIEDIPAPYFYPAEDCFRLQSSIAETFDLRVSGRCGLNDVRRNVAEDDPRVSPDVEILDVDACTTRAVPTNTRFYWLAYAYDRETIFWSLSLDGRRCRGGEITLTRGTPLRDALTETLLGTGTDVPWPVDETESYDFNRDLLVADSVEESLLTGHLSMLLPDEIHSHVHGEVPVLLISPVAELAGVPWPILPLSQGLSPARRLVEDYEIRILPSLASLHRADRAPLADQQTRRQLMLACDHYDGDVGSGAGRTAAVRLGSHSQIDVDPHTRPATILNLVAALRAIRPGTPGIAYFRAHFDWHPESAEDSGIKLADGSFSSGFLFAGSDGSSLLGMPSTVIFSCCAIADTRRGPGGESLGIIAAAISCGARDLLVSMVRIEQTTFTNAFDQLMVEVCEREGSSASNFHDLQLRMLAEWRRYSMRGIGEEDTWTPKPAVWAYYNYCGLAR